MKVAIVNVAIAHFLARLVLILTTASEIYIVMSSGGLFDSIDGDPRDIGQVCETPKLLRFRSGSLILQLWCCVFFGLAILVLSVIAWRAPAFEVPLDTGPYGARYGGSWLSRRRKMVLNRVFIQDPSSPVPTRYWRACGGVLFLDTLCLILWIVAITLAFPWNKERFLALLRGEPVGERYSDGAIEIWSQRWLPIRSSKLLTCVYPTQA